MDSRPTAQLLWVSAGLYQFGEAGELGGTKEIRMHDRSIVQELPIP